MPKKATHVYQFKVTLEKIKPSIWRRIQVPDTYTFGNLHYALQKAMGWDFSHMHEFTIFNPKTGQKEVVGPAQELEDESVIEEQRQLLSSYFSTSNKEARYEYDFGDSWIHKIRLEKILPLDPAKKYPVCLAGERACPPEDCGGIWGYEELLKILSDPNHPEYEEMSEWVESVCIGERFDPEAFDPESAFAFDVK